MGRYKQSKYHHENEFVATLPMMLAKYWFHEHRDEVLEVCRRLDVEQLLFWTEGSLALEQVTEYVIHNKLTAVQDILWELAGSHLGIDFKEMLHSEIHPRGDDADDRGERRALKHGLLKCEWCPPIAYELEDMISEAIVDDKKLSASIAALRKQANQVKAVIQVHES